MAYLGNTPTTQSFISGTDYFNGTGSQTAFTLSRTVASINDIQVTVNNVVQQPNDAYTISGTTLTMTSAPSAGTNNVYVRYLSTTTQAITPSQGTVSWSTLNSDVQQDLGISYKNRIINGNMVIDQRNAGASVTLNGSESYITDRFACGDVTDGVFTAQQVTDAPAGFINSLKCTITTADSSLTATQNAYCFQSIEGLNIADLAWGTASAKTVTLSFWVKSSLTGTFGGALRNSAANRSYPYSYTISSANTWEQKTVTIVGDTTGTWLTTNGVGINLQFSLGAGSDRTGTAGAWNSNNNVGATGQVQVIGTLNATWQITGVQLEVGTQATTFTTAGGSYGAELVLCQRYFQRTQYYATSGGYPTFTSYIGLSIGANNWFWHSVYFPVTMRTDATITTSDFNGNIGKISIWTSSGGATASNINPYTLTSSRDAFSYSEYDNAKFGIGINGYIASAEL